MGPCPPALALRLFRKAELEEVFPAPSGLIRQGPRLLLCGWVFLLVCLLNFRVVYRQEETFSLGFF